VISIKWNTLNDFDMVENSRCIIIIGVVGCRETKSLNGGVFENCTERCAVDFGIVLRNEEVGKSAMDMKYDWLRVGSVAKYVSNWNFLDCSAELMRKDRIAEFLTRMFERELNIEN
jgi:hypothetical protein